MIPSTEWNKEVKACFTAGICLEDLRRNTNPDMDERLARLGDDFQILINQMIQEGASEVMIRWTNIRSTDAESDFYNPHGNIGRFYITAYRSSKPKPNPPEWKAVTP